MALVKAVVAGTAAALLIPYVARGGSGKLVEWLQYGLVRVDLGDWHFAWSWPLFCAMTLFAWALLAAVER